MFEIQVSKSYFVSLFSLQESHTSHLQSKLDGATQDIESLSCDVDTLKAGLNAIAEMFQNSAGEPATPTHEFEADCVANEKTSSSVPEKETSPSSNRRKAGSSSIPNWITSPVSLVFICSVQIKI